MKVLRKILAVAMLASPVFVFAQGTPSAYTEADLVWQENFNARKLNTRDWNYETHEPGWVNEELQSYGNSSKNTYLKDGALVIQAIKTENRDGTIDYTSGRINTQGKHSWMYGRFEARLKVPKGPGFLPAFWMMPEDESYYGQWPKCGEIDIMEVLGHDTNRLYGTLHYGEPHAQAQGTYDVEAINNFADNYHVFAVEWEPGEIRWYCDGVNYKTVNDWFTKRPGFNELTYPAPFDQPFYIILNVAVGGSWVGYPDETTNFDPASDDAKMYVDYVKVYQKKSYDMNVTKPEREPVVASTDSTGNMVKSGTNSWQILTTGGGAGSIAVNSDNLDILSTAEGSLEYSVQVVQPNVPLNYGYIYKYSFDAYADSNRTIITGITAPDNSYERRFGDVKIDVTTVPQHYQWTFSMMADSDPHTRIEYNLGAQGSVAGVHISNIRLEKVGEVDLSKLVKNCLPDGNYIFNGAFQEGEARLGNWQIENNVNADVSVTNDRQRMLKVVSPKRSSPQDVVVKQTGIKVNAGASYVVKFDAYSLKSGYITARFAGLEKRERVLPLATKNSAPGHYEWKFTADEDGEIDFELLLGSDGNTIFVDNVFLKENRVVINGNLDNGMSGWEVYYNAAARVGYEIVEDNGDNQIAITIDNSGTQDWNIQFKQSGCLLEKGKTYKITLKAKSDLSRTIMLALQRDGSRDDNWYPYSDTLKFNVSEEWSDYEWIFTMGQPTDENVIFTISMGAVNDRIISTRHTIMIDSINVEEIER